ERLAAGRVTLVGCGALGTVIANHLVRAGVGFVRIADRDFIELHNLQRQVLFDEDDVSAGIPKAEAAARKLRRVNSTVQVEAVVVDVDRTNILSLVDGADVILDGSDNFEIRYIINDAAVKLGKPWVYGGCIGSHGQSMTILPGDTPCLRCVFEAAPGPGEAATCETAGVVAPAVAMVASLQSCEALKLLAGRRDAINRELIYLDVWENVYKKIKIAPLKGKVDCPCCGRGQYEWLDGDHGATTTSLCGRNAVQVSHRSASPLRFEDLASQLSPLGPVTFNKFLLKFDSGDHKFTVFPDGRAIIQGTDDPDKARTLYAKYIGH
ncbi:MAG: ThiF family adenylyltransferase, partial [Gemmataceae bacterium]|nr:ThiF family adenylyltransferase [Gemmataceae bacterium]